MTATVVTTSAALSKKKLSLQISLTVLPGSRLGLCVCVCVLFLLFVLLGWLLVSFFGEICFQSQAHSSC